MDRIIKKSILLGILIIGISEIYSQQDYHYSQYMFSQMDINPGSAGSSDMITLTGHNRNQWVGFDGAPVTNSFTVDAPFKLFGINSGAGITAIISDNLGFMQDAGIKLSYAYRADVGSGKLGIGVSGGFLQKTIKVDQFYGYNSSKGIIENVSNIPTDANKIGPDMSIGLFYNTDDVYLGISSTHILGNVYNIEGSSGNIDFTLARHFFLTGGYKIKLDNPLFELTPSMMFYSDFGTSQFIGNATLTYNKKVWGGVSYRVGSAIIGMVGFELGNHLQFGYSYDFDISGLGQYYRSSHELMLRYSFSLDVDKMPKQYKSIRYL